MTVRILLLLFLAPMAMRCSTSVVSLPGGTVQIGTSAEELERLRALYPDVSARVLEGELPERTVQIAPFRIDRYEATGKTEHPLVNVTWQEAADYCRARGGRLPTEAEWEYAARGGLVRKLFPWGDEPAGPERANYHASGIKTTTPVGSYPPNGFGLFDMSGNVWEWTADAWDTNGRYVIRGGSWGGAPVNLRAGYRDSHRANDPRDFVGFRCAY
ncbi:MAG TPA: SUMF1/EgtB/PvdO family nonheme iron enzyme [Thermoanaerobaculia bacterium]|nr:SUMF1/EgtB/PvdO family nonheme iron enzyme [Thermoanaerobaculia bacterium]